MSAIDASMLAAWETARTNMGESMTFAQRSAPAYDVATGASSGSATSTTVTGIICLVDKSRVHAFDHAAVKIDLSVQVKRSELAAAPKPSDLVTIDSVVYEVVSAVQFTFGVTQCNLRAVS